MDSRANATSPLLSPGTGMLACLSALALLYFGLLKALFGSFSITTVIETYKKKSEISKRYNELFQSRENLMYHISWAKARGEPDVAKQMAQELVDIDKDIDQLESTYAVLFGYKKIPNQKMAPDNEKNI